MSLWGNVFSSVRPNVGAVTSALTQAMNNTVSWNPNTATAPSWAAAVYSPAAPQTYSLNLTGSDYDPNAAKKRANKMAAIQRSNEGTGTEYQSGFQYGGMDPNAAIQAGQEADRPEWQKALARSYDLQRQTATAEQEGERARMEERAKGRLAGQGFESGSGLQEKVLGQLDIASSKNLSNRLGQLDVAEQAAMGDRQSQFDLAALQNGFAEGRIRLSDAIADDNATNEAIATSWFNRGADPTGANAPTSAELVALQTSNPRAYAAYMSGKAGRSYADFKAAYDRETDITNALILNASSMSGGAFNGAILDIAKAAGINLDLSSGALGSINAIPFSTASGGQDVRNAAIGTVYRMDDGSTATIVGRSERAKRKPGSDESIGYDVIMRRSDGSTYHIYPSLHEGGI